VRTVDRAPAFPGDGWRTDGSDPHRVAATAVPVPVRPRPWPGGNLPEGTSEGTGGTVRNHAGVRGGARRVCTRCGRTFSPVRRTRRLARSFPSLQGEKTGRLAWNRGSESTVPGSPLLPGKTHGREQPEEYCHLLPTPRPGSQLRPGLGRFG